jgi:hypothetical protein
MAYFAKLDNTNTVMRVISVSNDICGEPTLGFPETESAVRKQYAGVGYTYDADADVFVAPQAFPSWSLDDNHDWQAPTPKPEGDFYWDEESLSWLATPVG